MRRIVPFVAMLHFLLIATTSCNAPSTDLSSSDISAESTTSETIRFSGKVTGLEGDQLVIGIASAERTSRWKLRRNGPFRFAYSPPPDSTKKGETENLRVILIAQPKNPSQLCILNQNVDEFGQYEPENIVIKCHVRGDLLDSAPIESLDIETLNVVFPGFGISFAAKYGVRIERITYTTEMPNGSVIRASAAVMIPQDRTSDLSMISLQHGTIIYSGDAPSRSPAEGIAEASRGFFVVTPDYIGFGDSSDMFHPYHIAETYFPAVFDAITAARKFCATQSIGCNDRIYLQGYSEGGYATISVLRQMAVSGQSIEGLQAAAAGAGAYTLYTLMLDTMQKNSVPHPYYLAYIIVAYNDYYNLGIKLDSVFASPYDARIDDLFNGETPGPLIDLHLSDNPQILFTESIRSSLSGSSPLTDRLRENSLAGDWKPEIPVHLYHCTEDEVVSLQSSQTLFESLQSAGSDVSLSTESGHHADCPLIFAPVQWFEELESRIAL